MPWVKADRDLCKGYGNCAMTDPDVFDVDGDGTVLVLRESVPEADRSRVEAAVRSCPVSALSVQDE
ncbi:MAG: ferredoxin [Micromonosporaceae bacterium]|nr:ferredoxin [Micromonosporaceae bacterium]